ncbi:hypothetical protein GCM10009584_24930 [Ornithinimicrobium humiphilum]|uniref:SnoaL-like protein n=1 Tax=Ornithinimicrobium humiphilum TaxID=125288 RepID=A0A543KMA9_9MICO|nr:nuclear transport factor 2 family protein [Ornithinimicrobium humiphilum]TQM96217.1 SnoaL-like protein [Ornithinimicrobium humiphilum]
MTDDLATRLRRIEDRLEIEELLARYANACDDRDMAALGACFASDFEFDSVAGHAVGREAALDYYRGRLGLYGMTFHIPHTLVLQEHEQDTAAGLVTSHAEMELERELFVTGFRYSDRYVREQGRWCFRARHVQAFYAMPLGQLAQGLDEYRLRWPHAGPQRAPLPELLPSWDDFQRSRST